MHTCRAVSLWSWLTEDFSDTYLSLVELAALPGPFHFWEECQWILTLHSADHLETSAASSAPAAGLVAEGYEAAGEAGIHNVHPVFAGATNTPFCSWACLG